MRPFTSTISFDEARRRLAAAVVPIDRTERVPLAAAGWRVAAEDIVSPIEVPPFARAAMDGYALVAADTAAATERTPVTLPIVERLYTGSAPSRTIAPGTCAEIATGAPLPAGADAVVMVEQTARADSDAVKINAAATAGQNIGRRGADISTGATVLRAGELLNPGRIGAV